MAKTAAPDDCSTVDQESGLETWEPPRVFDQRKGNRRTELAGKKCRRNRAGALGKSGQASSVEMLTG